MSEYVNKASELVLPATIEYTRHRDNRGSLTAQATVIERRGRNLLTDDGNWLWWLECRRCGVGQSSRTAIFDCSKCQTEVCNSCKNEHRCGETYCGHCDELTDHITVNCVLPIVN